MDFRSYTTKILLSPINYSDYNKDESIALVVYGIEALKLTTKSTLVSRRFYLHEYNKDILYYISHEKNLRKSRYRISELERVELFSSSSDFFSTKLVFNKNSAASLVFSQNKTLSLVFKSPEQMMLWLSGIHYILNSRYELTNTKNLIDNEYTSKLWSKAGKDKNGLLGKKDIKSLMKKMNLYPNNELIDNILKKFKTGMKSMIDRSEFNHLIENAFDSSEISKIFHNYSKNSSIMTRLQFREFCNHEQTNSVEQNFSPEEPDTIFDEISCEFNGEKMLSLSQFRDCMFSPLHNSLINKEKLKIYMDMTQPLAHYFISSSHNTYLEGHQLAGKSSQYQYSKVLLEGCKCLEIDTWDGPDQPVVTHGHTFVSSIPLVDVALEIKKSAFVTSPYPLILSVENHCGYEQTGFIGQIFKDILIDIYIPDGSAPSPEDLKYKFIIKGKITKPHSDSGGTKFSHPVFSNVVGLVGTRFKSFEQDPWSIVSFKEKKLMSIAKKHNSTTVIQYHSKVLSRVYPKGQRISSSNYLPINDWVLGAQLVAINYQSSDTGKLINTAWFLNNGNCGYVLKPEFMRNSTVSFDFDSEDFECCKVRLSLVVISAFNLPKVEGNSDIVSPLVEVQVYGVPKDAQALVTKTVEKNGFNPVWNEEFFIDINVPELCVLSFRVYSENLQNSQLVAQFAIGVSCVNVGYRCVQMLDVDQNLLPNTFLLCKINKN